MDYWNKLKISINCENNMYKFARSEEVTKKYDSFRENVSDIFEHLNHTLFNNGKILVFRKNDFPYKFDGNISHYLIWINPIQKKIPNKSYLIKFLSTELMKLDLDIVDYILFKNNIINKSVDTIEHYHVLIRYN